MPQFKFNTISRTDIESSSGGSQMLLAIDYDGSDNLLITGCAGSGKTTVSLMRAERLTKMRKNIVLVTYQHLLVTNLKNSASAELAKNIYKFHQWYRRASQYNYEDQTYSIMESELAEYKSIDEIIIDEGQNFAKDIHKILMSKCNKITIGADNAQKIHKGLMVGEIRNEIELKGVVFPIKLQYNYRNTFEIYNFARYFLPDNEKANNDLAINMIPKGKGEKPTVYSIPDDNTELAQLYTLLSDAGDKNTAVLLYYKSDVDKYRGLITSMGFGCSSHHHENHIGGQIENILVTTFKSAQGLEFETVIMLKMETAMLEYYQTAEHYYIGCTRAKENLFLFVNSPSLPDYFSFFDKDSYIHLRALKQDAPKKITSDHYLEEDDLPF